MLARGLRSSLRRPFQGSHLAPGSRLIAHATGSGAAKPQIEDLAKLAQISVSPPEAADWASKIGSVLDW
jgi:hypothetical protein